MNPSSRPAEQAEIEDIARRILAKGTGKVSLDRLNLLSRLVMRITMRDGEFRTQLFRFVDVFPRLERTEDVYEHAQEYLGAQKAARGMISVGLNLLGKLPGGKRLVEAIMRKNIQEVAKLFIAGTSAAEIASQVSQYRSEGLSTTVDVLGEKTLTETEARNYSRRVKDLVTTLAPLAGSSSHEAAREIPELSISIKPTALSPHYASISSEIGLVEVKTLLKEILLAISDARILCFLDMEDHDVKDLTLDLVESLASDGATATLYLGVVVQAYLLSAEEDLARVLAISQARTERGWIPLSIRLVKGAYFDAEMVKASTESWLPPTFASKAETDQSFERCAVTLLENIDIVRPAFATHNLRSIAFAIATARAMGVADGAYEVQMLYGMAEAMARGVRSEIPRVRLYLPMGELVPGMSYLVRRLIENTANESFLRRGFIEGGPSELAKMLAPPLPQASVHRANAKPAAIGPLGEYRHQPALETYLRSAREEFAKAIVSLRNEGIESIFGAQCAGGYVPIVINQERLHTQDSIESVNPAEFTEVIAQSASAEASHALAALEGAARAYAGWGATPVALRAEVLERAAEWITQRRVALAALEVLEAGKPWREADSDITETIDFLRFYARSMIELSSDTALSSPLGEVNRHYLRPRGVCVVISPWNFPMAIPMGMTAAAIVTGNSVVLKPAEQTPATAFAIFAAFDAAGLPPGVLNFLPGDGERIGPVLVEDPRVSTIAFTGSYAVGTSIISSAAQVKDGQRDIKRVITEMGGKNPIVVDADADLDQVVPGVMTSAFGFSGQKCSACSRLIVHQVHAAELIDRLKGALAALIVGDPAHPEVQLGPLIDIEAVQRVERYAKEADSEAEVVRYQGVLPTQGFFVAPALVINPPAHSKVLSDEIFGPLLCIEVVPDIDEAINRANASDYALTAGIYSRSPQVITRLSRSLVAGNIYVNRHITGAIPGRQPFGGFQHSGVGFKAGSREYLLQFTNSVVVTENTLRQGFVPEIT